MLQQANYRQIQNNTKAADFSYLFNFLNNFRFLKIDKIYLFSKIRYV